MRHGPLLAGLVVLLLVSGSRASLANDRTATLLAQLGDWCNAHAPFSFENPAPLGLILALADGRSAAEFADAFKPSRCVVSVGVRGAGADELVALSIGGAGAILWVDEGWWRAATVDEGDYIQPEIIATRPIVGGQEVLIGICRCGSGGNAGVIGLRLQGGRRQVLFRLDGASHVTAHFLDDDHVLVVGRHLEDRPYAWPQNCCLPSGYEWLYSRVGSRFVLTAERQAIDPYFALSAYFGAVKSARPDALADVADEPARDAAVRLTMLGPIEVSANSTPEAFAISDAELLRWDRLPASLRSAPGLESFYWGVTIWNYVPGHGLGARLVTGAVLMVRDGRGWRVGSLELDREITRGPR
jgi:hypothetical protein